MNEDYCEQFRDAIRSAGLEPPEMIEADGKLRRFASNGKRSDDAGWYLLHGDGIPAGAFGDWRTGISETWRANIGRTLTPTEEAAHRRKWKTCGANAKRKKPGAKPRPRRRRQTICQAAQPARDDHPYLKRKGIKAHGARLHNGALVIPMRDGGELHSLQFIGPDGEKRFLTGGRVAGCYFSIGAVKESQTLCIAEGYATGATIHEATGYPVAVAFSAGNLEPVARALREKFPDLRLIICADDDVATEGNPGVTKATEAARSVGGLVAIPDFGTDRPEGATDFNDMVVLRGAEAVTHAIAGATHATSPAGNSDSSDWPEPLPLVTEDRTGALPIGRAAGQDPGRRCRGPEIHQGTDSACGIFRARSTFTRDPSPCGRAQRRNTCRTSGTLLTNHCGFRRAKDAIRQDVLAIHRRLSRRATRSCESR